MLASSFSIKGDRCHWELTERHILMNIVGNPGLRSIYTPSASDMAFGDKPYDPEKLWTIPKASIFPYDTDEKLAGVIAVRHTEIVRG